MDITYETPFRRGVQLHVHALYPSLALESGVGSSGLGPRGQSGTRSMVDGGTRQCASSSNSIGCCEFRVLVKKYDGV